MWPIFYSSKKKARFQKYSGLNRVGRSEKKTRGVKRTVFKFFAVVVCLFIFLLSFFEYPLIGASAYESGIFNFGFNFYGPAIQQPTRCSSICNLVLPTLLDEFGLQ